MALCCTFDPQSAAADKVRAIPAGEEAHGC